MDVYDEIMNVIDDYIMTKTREDLATGERYDVSYINKGRFTAFLKKNYTIDRASIEQKVQLDSRNEGTCTKL